MGFGITGLFPQVVKFKGDPIVGVKVAAVAKVSVFCYQDLKVETKEPMF